MCPRFYRISLVAGCLAASVVGFVCTPSFATHKPSKSRIFTSLSVPPSNSLVYDNDDNGGNEFSSRRYYIKRGVKEEGSLGGTSNSFRRHMRRLTQTIRNKRACAAIMDDELETMEIRWYGGPAATDYRRHTGKPRSTYRGPAVRPDLSCYAMVANAYAKSGLGIEGAELAESILKRCESHVEYDQFAIKPNTILWSAVMSAWAKADQWKKAREWLQYIENAYATTQDEKDAPDAITYTTFLEALSASKYLSGKEIVRKATEIMEHMNTVSESGENVYAAPNTFTYSAAMKCLERGRNGVEPVESLLRTLQEKYKASGDSRLKPSARAYIPVLTAWSRCTGGKASAQRAEALKDELRDLYEQTGDFDYRPRDAVYTAVMSAYSRVEPEASLEASKKVDDLLMEIENDPEWNPSIYCYTAAINAKAHSGLASDVDEAEKILRRMPKHDSHVFQCVIKAHAKIGNAAQAEALLMEMEELVNAGYIRRRADVLAHSACASAWATEFKSTGNMEDLERADAMLHRMVSLYREGSLYPGEKHAHVGVFEKVIQQWGMSHDRHAGERAENVIALIEEMRNMVDEGGDPYAPTPYAYTYAIDSWAKSGEPEASKRVMALLNRMEAHHSEEANFPNPNIRAVSSALAAVVNRKDVATVTRSDIDLADNLMRRILQLYVDGDRSSMPNVRTYTAVLGMMAKSKVKNADLRALNLFRYIRNTHDQNDNNDLAPNEITYNCVIHGLAKRGRLNETEMLVEEMEGRCAEGHKEERPGLVTYSTAIEAYRNSNREDTTKRVEAVLDKIEAGYRAGDIALKPDAQLFNIVMRVLANAAHKDPSAAEQAHNLLKRMEMSTAVDKATAPNLISYTNVCLAYANSNITDSAEKAEEILRQVEALADKDTLPHPDLFLYAAVILAYTRNNSVASQLKAEALFNHTVSLYKSGSPELVPSNRVMNSMIAGWATSKCRDKVKNARAVLDRMNSMYEDGNDKCQPDMISYNWVIQAAARSKHCPKRDRAQNFLIAVDAFKRLHRDDSIAKPSQFTYVFFLRACNRLLPPGEDRDKLIRNAFTLACRNGLMGDVLFRQMKAFLPNVLKQAMEAEGVEVQEDISELQPSLLPKKWRQSL